MVDSCAGEAPAARQARSPLYEARALEGVSRCRARTGQQEVALSDISEAVASYQRIGAAEEGPARAYMARLGDG